jgi:hypothetical protein
MGYYPTREVGSNNDEEVDHFLHGELGISASAVQKLKQSAPFMFCRSVDHHLRPTIHFLAGILQKQATNNIQGKINVQIDEAVRRKIGKIVSQNPSLLSLSLEDNLMPTCDFLRKNIHMDKGGLASMLRSCPSILGLSVEDNLRLTHQFLVEEVGLSDDNDLRRCVSRHPQILALSLENLRAKTNFFHLLESLDGNDYGSVDNNSELENRDSKRSLAARVAVSAPSAYSLSLHDNLVPKIKALAKLWGSSPIQIERIYEMSEHAGLSSQSTNTHFPAGGELSRVTKQLKEYPNILTLSLDSNLLPTIEFYNQTGYLSLDAAGFLQGCDNMHKECEDDEEARDRDPKTLMRARYLASSLVSRLLPRWHFFQENGKRTGGLRSSTILAANTTIETGRSNTKDKPHKAIKQPPLHVLAMYDDAKFCSHLALDVEDFVEYTKATAKQLKFSSQFANWIKSGTPID